MIEPNVSIETPVDINRENVYEEWEETLEAILSSGGTTMIVGGTDVGKTTFTRLLVNRACSRGLKVALLDADVGQSEIGPPTCVGLAHIERPIVSFLEASSHAIAFVGATSPANYASEHIVAVKKMAELAGERLLIIDTAGYIHGSGARRLAHLEFDLINPSHIVGLQRKSELNPILQGMRHRRHCQIHTPSIPKIIGVKPPAFRAQRRAMRFASYFQNSVERSFAFDEIAMTGTWLCGGSPVAAHLFRFISETLGRANRLFHAESAGTHLGLMMSQPIPPSSPELGLVMEQLKVKELSVTVAPRLKHLLLGLQDGNGKTLGLGVMTKLDFRRRTLSALTPISSASAVSCIRFGRHRTLPDGTDAGALKPGDC